LWQVCAKHRKKNGAKIRLIQKKAVSLCQNNIAVENLIQQFERNNGFLRTKDLHSRSDWRNLRKLADSDTIVKIKRGLYRLNDDTIINQHAEIANTIPDGVFCMFTAWQYYNLSVYNPFEFYVAIRKKQKIVLPKYPPVKLFYWIDDFYLLGITEGIIDNQKIKIYDLEKSVCDAIRFRNKIGIDTMSEVIKNYLKRKDKNLNKLTQYAKILRIEKTLQTIIMPML